jgi:hypothetical protein
MERVGNEGEDGDKPTSVALHCKRELRFPSHHS